MPTRPRVLLHAFSTFNLGGPQARFVQLANEFGPAYHHVIVAMDNCFVAGDRLGSQVSWEPLRLDIQKGGALANRANFRAILKERRPDLLLSYNWGAIEWAAANTPKVVPHVHVEDGFGPEEANGQLPRRVWMRRILLALRRVPMVVASRHLGRIAREQWWMPAKQVQFIPNGVETPSDLSRKTPEPDQPLVIGTVAGLRPEKNVGRLIRAFSELRSRMPAKLVIVGDGPQRAGLEQLAMDRGIATEVEFVGYLQNPIERLRAFDLFALSSDTEQLPISLLEAMACGVPVVATRVGDILDIIPPAAVHCVTDPDDRAFARSLLEVVALRDQWPNWIAAGCDVVSRCYSLGAMHTAWKRVFEGENN
jgi:glycosyltransferase involved in cell wall biosynthesis